MISFYNTLSRQKEEFIPIKKGVVNMYSCGPTVYNYAHIGNYRAYVFADILKRFLSYEGYKVTHVMNVTDIDDKTIKGAKKENKSLKEFTEFYTEEFKKDTKSLNILPPSKLTKATDYIDEMVEIIKKLISKNLAYKSEDGSIYFRIKNFKNYGKLSRLILKDQKENAQGRIKTDEYEKDDAQDFALWKAWDADDGEVYWDTTLGKGRPGWHIECSAMSMANLGKKIDIHTGGVDNIFPHHENEIAQSEGATGETFVHYWMHNEWVLVDHKKMAKSDNNFYILKDLKDKDIYPVVYRFWLLMANYRTRVNFVWEALEGANIALKRLFRLYTALGDDIGKIDEKYQRRFKKCLSDDLDTPRALVVLWDLVKDDDVTNPDKKATILDFDKVLGLGFADQKIEEIKETELPEEVLLLVDERRHARENKDFTASDDIRKQINLLGYEVKDLPDGSQKIIKS